MPQEDQHATELNHPEKVSRVTFPAAADPAKVLQPGEQPLNLPSPQVAAQRPPILGSLSAATVGGNHLDAMFAPQPLIQDEWQGETRLRVRLCGRSCSAVCTVRRMDARQMHAAADSGCNETAQLMYDLPNYGSVLVATEITALWRRSGDGRRTLRAHAPLAMERRTISAGDLPEEDFWPATTGLCSGPHIQSRRTSTCWALAVLLAAPCGNAPAPGSAGRDLDRGTRPISRVESGRPLLCRARDNCRAWRVLPRMPDPCQLPWCPCRRSSAARACAVPRVRRPPAAYRSCHRAGRSPTQLGRVLRRDTCQLAFAPSGHNLVPRCRHNTWHVRKCGCVLRLSATPSDTRHPRFARVRRAPSSPQAR